MFTFRMLGVFLTVALLTGCTQVSITGSGDVVYREESISGFEAVDVSHSFEVDITKDESFIRAKAYSSCSCSWGR